MRRQFRGAARAFKSMGDACRSLEEPLQLLAGAYLALARSLEQREGGQESLEGAQMNNHPREGCQALYGAHSASHETKEEA